MDSKNVPAVIAVGFFVLIFGCIFASLFVQFDFAPASGKGTGFISFQEKSGIFQIESICWRDTALSECEVFDPDGKNYEPGKYQIDYSCGTFAWAWEKPLCKILTATRLGDA
ncbi:hypothetical protein HYT84_01720 [Candidatus Micrarchaeota archaeon]|nr:hypothetical protein [Candidatus Micrarchaeota archaeon]